MRKEEKNINFNTGKFKAPEGYSNELKDELKLKTLLSESSSPFKVPNGYFDKLSKEINEATDTPIRSISRNIWFKIGTVSSVAASLIAAILWYQTEQECETFACLMEQTELEPDDLVWLESSYIEEAYQVELADTFTEEEENIIDLVVEEDWDLDYLLEE